MNNTDNVPQDISSSSSSSPVQLATNFCIYSILGKEQLNAPARVPSISCLDQQFFCSILNISQALCIAAKCSGTSRITDLLKLSGMVLNIMEWISNTSTNQQDLQQQVKGSRQAEKLTANKLSRVIGLLSFASITHNVSAAAAI